MTTDANEFFREVTVRICGRLDIENALCECLQYLREHLPADRLSLMLFEKGFGSMRVLARATPEEGKLLELVVPLNLSARDEMSTGDAQAEAGPFGPMVDNGPESPTVLRMLETFGEPPSSVMILPLVLRGVPLGSVVVLAHGSNRFQGEHIRLFASLREPFFLALSNAVEHQKVVDLKERLADDNRFLQRELREREDVEIVGARFGLASVMELVSQVAPRTSPVLLLGETGTGKDLIAQALHEQSPRHDGPFLGVNCGAIPDTLLDSELFGHEEGAFTGAVRQARGRFERAHRGTLFLDEVGELTPAAQVRLLRVLETGEIERVGGSRPLSVDTRVVAATHRDLEQMVSEGTFREDLWFRLAVFPIAILPLRERAEDIPALVHHFVARKAVELKLPETPTLAPGALDRLLDYPWPGNVRELQNVVERALIISGDAPLTFDHLVATTPSTTASPPAPPAGPTTLSLDAAMARHIRTVLARTGGKVHGPGGAAELLEINPSTLRNRMNKLAIPYGRHHTP